MWFHIRSTTIEAPLGSATEGGYEKFLTIAGKLASTHVAITPRPDTIEQRRHLTGKLPVGQLERKQHSTNLHLRVCDDLLHTIERKLWCNVHVGHQPSNADKLAATQVGTTHPQVVKVRMR